MHIKKKQLTGNTRIPPGMNEAAAKFLQDVRDKEAVRIAEEKRLEKLVIPYLDTLQKQIVERDQLSFWTFPDESGFKKIKIKSLEQMQAFINKTKNSETKSFKGNVANISISFYHHDKPTSIMRRAGYYFSVDITIFPIDKYGVINGAGDAWSASVSWTLADFKTTKFSLKLLKIIVTSVNRRLRKFPSILGFLATHVINELENAGVKFDNAIVPLSGTVI